MCGDVEGLFNSEAESCTFSTTVSSLQFEGKVAFRNSIAVMSSAITSTLYGSTTPLGVQAPPPVMACYVIRNPNLKLVYCGVVTHGKTVV